MEITNVKENIESLEKWKNSKPIFPWSLKFLCFRLDFVQEA
jgi:hypothetical protein